MKYNKLYIGIILSLAVLLVYVDSQAPKEVDWNRTFKNNDKNPFGMEVFYKTMPEVFEGQAVETVRIPPFNQLNEGKQPAKSNYIIIDQYLENGYTAKGLSGTDVKELISYITRGNNAFLVANSFPEQLLDTLNLKMTSVSLTPPNLKAKIKAIAKPLKVKLVNRIFNGKTVRLEKEAYEGYFLSRDTLDVKALAVNDSSHANFIRYKIGKGQLFLGTVPELFSNYYLLKDDKDPIAFKIISYLPVLPTFYDEYTKQGRLEDQSLFRFVKRTPALHVVYYLCIAGLLLYIFFEGKRRQRIIPVIEAKQNTTLNFISTVGLLFYQKKDNLALALKKTEYLKWTIYKRTGIRFEGYSDEFTNKLIQKTALDAEEIKSLLRWMQTIERMKQITDADLITFNHMIESFNKKTI